jgi:hypothetical protein
MGKVGIDLLTNLIWRFVQPGEAHSDLIYSHD